MSIRGSPQLESLAVWCTISQGTEGNTAATPDCIATATAAAAREHDHIMFSVPD